MRGTVSPGIVRIGSRSEHFHNVYTSKVLGIYKKWVAASLPVGM